MGGVVAGALVGLLLFAVDFALGSVGFMGMRDPRVIAEVMERARAHAVEQQLLALAVLVVVGALMGAVGVASGRAWELARGRAARRSFGYGAVGAVVGHGYFLARSMAQFPSLYSAHFYERGGVARAAMLLVTDHLSTTTLDASLALLLAVALVLPMASALGRAWSAKHARLILGATSLAVLALALPLLHRPRSTPQHDRPNVLIIAVDSLRSDRVFASDAVARFPAMASLAARGVRFRRAYVTQARTFPSFVTLLTGRYSSHHGIRHEFPTAAARQSIGPSLPSLLSASGWHTAVISDFSGEIFSRASLGFDEVDVPRLDLFAIVAEQILHSHPNLLPYASTRFGRRLFPAMGISAELEDPVTLAERAGAELDRLAASPFFLTVFFSAPHTPYASPTPWWKKFADADYRGPFRYVKQPLPQLAGLPPPDAAQVQALYDGAVGSVDEAVGALLRRLDEDGLTDNTIVVLLGDHGENLFDVPGRGMGHGDHLWGDLANHIPLVIADRRYPPRDVDGIVRDVDLTPTLSALLGVKTPPGDGVDLTPLLAGVRDSNDSDAFEESGLWLLASGPGYRSSDRLPYPDLWHATEAGSDGDIFLQPRFEQASNDAKYRAIVTPRWKLVYQPTPSGTFWRLFDLDADPLQRDDVAAQHPDVVSELRVKLQDWIQR